MKKVIFLITTFIFVISGTSFADPWRITKYPRSSPFYGQPFKVLKVDVVKEIIKDGKAYYQYKIILKRPSWDDTTGVVRTNSFNLRLYYFAAGVGKDPYISIYRGLTVGQHKKHGHPRKIVLYLFEGYRPDNKYKKRIRIGLLPYPMIAGYDVRSAIGVHRSDYKSLLSVLLQIATIKEAILGKIKDVTIDSVLDRMLTYYGAVIELEVLSKVPNIRGMSKDRAINELKMRRLIPCITGYKVTNNKRLHGKVIGYSRKIPYVTGNRVHAKTKLCFNVWKYKKYSDNRVENTSSLNSLAGTWKFGRANTGQFLSYLELTKKPGKYGAYIIGGMHHENESYWKPIGSDTIIFYHAKGYKTTVFRKVGHNFFKGRFIPPPGWKGGNVTIHYLKK